MKDIDVEVVQIDPNTEGTRTIKNAVEKLQNLTNINVDLKSNNIDNDTPSQLIENPLFERRQQRKEPELIIKQQNVNEIDPPSAIYMIDNIVSMLKKNNEEDRLQVIKKTSEPTDVDVIVEKSGSRKSNKEVGDVDDEIQQSLILEQDLSDDEEDGGEEDSEHRERFVTARASLMKEL